MITFTVSYEVITPSSAAHGDFEDAGILYPSITLREAIEELSGAAYADALNATLLAIKKAKGEE